MKKIFRKIAVALLASALVSISFPTVAQALITQGSVRVAVLGADAAQNPTKFSAADLKLIVFQSGMAIATIRGKDVSASGASGEDFEFTSVPADPSYTYVAVTSGPADDVYYSPGIETPYENADINGGGTSWDSYWTGLSTSWTGLSTTETKNATLTVSTETSGSGTVSGQAFDSAKNGVGGTLVTGLEVFSANNTTYWRRSVATTDSLGRYSLVGIRPQSSITLFADSTDGTYWWSSSTLTISSRFPNRKFNLYAAANPVEGSGVFTASVVDTNGDPISSNDVVAYLDGSNQCDLSSSVVTCTMVPSGSHTVSVASANGSAPTYFAVDTTFTLATGSSTYNGGTIVLADYPAASGSIGGTLTANLSLDQIPNLQISYRALAVAGVPDKYFSQIQGSVAVNSDGTWLSQNLPNGTYAVSVWYTGSMRPNSAMTAAPAEQQITISDGQNVNVVFPQLNELEPEAGDRLNVVVKDSATRLPVVGAECRAYTFDALQNTEQQSTGTTDINGAVVFDAVLRGQSYSLKCETSTSTSKVEGAIQNAIVIAAGVNAFTLPVRVRQFQSATLAAKILDPNGEPLEGILVRASWSAGPNMGSNERDDVSNPDGSFAISGFTTADSVNLNLSDPSGTYAQIELNAPQSGTLTDLGNITMKPGTAVTGELLGSGNTKPDGEFTLYSSDSLNAYFASVSQGRVSFDVMVPAGTYTQFFSGSQPFESGYISSDGSLTADSHLAAPINISDLSPTFTLPDATVSQGGSISGAFKFVDAQGNRVNTASLDGSIRAWVKSGSTWTSTNYVGVGFYNGNSNTYTLDGLAAGTYKVCFSDDLYGVDTNRYPDTCIGENTGFQVSSGEKVTATFGTIIFAAPTTTANAVDSSALNSSLQGQVSVTSQTSIETTVQLDGDLAGQWVAAETLVDPTLQSASARRTSLSKSPSAQGATAIKVSAWLPVSATGQVEIPASAFTSAVTNKLVILSSQNLPIGFTNVQAPGLANLILTPSPKITGKAILGQSLKLTNASWDSGTVLSINWLRNGIAIVGARSQSYKLTARDLGASIAVRVSGAKTGFNSVTKTSAATPKVSSAPVMVAAPVISGSAKKGSILKSSAGIWQAFPAPSITFSWYRCKSAIAKSGANAPASNNCSAIKSASRSSYKLSSLDVGKFILVALSSKNHLGSAIVRSKTSPKVK